MSQDIISKKTRYEFREYLVGWTLREIELEFDAADIQLGEADPQPTSGARRSLVSQYYRSLDFTNWEDVRKLLKVYENILAPIKEAMENPDPTNWSKPEVAFNNLTKWLQKDGFIYQDGRLVAVGHSPTLPHLKATALVIDAAYLLDQIQMMERSVDSNPALAIGTAKELVETVCKTILIDRKVTPSTRADLPDLIKQVRDELQLTPDNIPDGAKAADIIKKLMSTLATIVHALAELRGSYGTGHGRDGRAKGLQPRHARLAVGAASALATFLFETHQERLK